LNLSKAAARLAIHLVDREFEGSPAEWIVLSGVPPKVILWGARGEEPDDQTLDTLANKYGTIPFVFSRPEQIS